MQESHNKVRLSVSWREMETIPAIPPNNATITSNNVGNVRVCSSGVGSPKGDKKKVNYRC